MRPLPTSKKVRSTALIYCEGAHDLIFVRHLMKLYYEAGKLQVKYPAKQGKGGSSDGLVGEILRIPGDFDRRLLKVDRDRDESEIIRAETLAVANQVVLIWTRPCLEALLLQILNGTDYSSKTSAQCKSIFRNIIPDNKRLSSYSYEKIFTLDIVEASRKTIPELDMLITFFTS